MNLRQSIAGVLPAVLVFGTLAVSTAVVWGDIPGGNRPRPRPEPPATVKLAAAVEVSEVKTIAGEPEQTVAKIEIPEAVLEQLLAQSQAQIFAPGIPSQTVTEAPTQPWSGTVIAGLCLAFAAVAAGLAWKRSAQRRVAMTSSALLLVSGLLVTGAFADIVRPGKPYTGPARRPPVAPAEAERQLVLQVAPGNGPVKLFLKRTAAPVAE